VLGLIAIGGVVIGLGIILLSPTGPRAPTSAPSSPWPSASGRPPTCYSIGTDPVPVLVLIVLLVEAAPFVALPMARGMGAVLVDVVATGAIVIERTEGAVALIGLGLAALVLRPTLELLGRLPAGTEPATAPWLVALVALLLTGAGFRSLRDQLVRKDTHQSRINELVENSAYQIKTPLTRPWDTRTSCAQRSVKASPATIQIRRGWEVSLGLDDLMIVSRADTDDLDVLEQPVDMAGAVEECLDHLIGSRAKTTHVDVRGSVLGDPVRVRHVVRHLVNNAVLHGGGSPQST
jgi:signal transduction histidine kinase